MKNPISWLSVFKNTQAALAEDHTRLERFKTALKELGSYYPILDEVHQWMFSDAPELDVGIVTNAVPPYGLDLYDLICLHDYFHAHLKAVGLIPTDSTQNFLWFGYQANPIFLGMKTPVLKLTVYTDREDFVPNLQGIVTDWLSKYHRPWANMVVRPIVNVEYLQGVELMNYDLVNNLPSLPHIYLLAPKD